MSAYRIPNRKTVVMGGASLAIAAVVALALAGTATAAPARHAASTPDLPRPAACTASQLAISKGGSQGGMQHDGFPIVYRNVSKRTCDLAGYPGVAAVNRHGHVVANAARTTTGYLAGAPDRTLRLRPGHDASAFVEWVVMNNHGGQCRSVAGIDTTAPNTTRTLHRSWPVFRCQLEIHPVTYGRSGSHIVRSPRGAARAAWIHGSEVIAAETGRYLGRAADDLASSTRHDYSTQVGELHRLAALPDTSLTGKQRRDESRLIDALDTFFHTPKLYR